MQERPESLPPNARELLALPAELFATLLEIADDAVVVVDESQHIVLFNRGAERIFGFRAEDALGQPLSVLLPESVIAGHAAHVAAFGASMRSARRMGERSEIFGRRANGEVFAAEASISHVQVMGCRYYAAILRDVSERKKIQAAIAASEARFRALAESSPVGVFQTDSAGAFVYVNGRWSEMAGMTMTEAAGEGWARGLHLEDRAVVYRQWKSAVGAGAPFRAEFRFVRPDGKETWVLGHAVPAQISAGEERGYIGTLTDITERKLQAVALEQAKQDAESAARAKSLFLANMSHEIRTPLNAVIGMTSLLMETPISEEQKDFAQTIRASGEALLVIINDILDYSKADLGKLELERQVFDLRRTVEDALDLLAPNASEKSLNLAYMIEEGTPETLIGDATRLRQILVNLISNAVKFTHHGEVAVNVDAQPLEGGRYRVHFAVRDSGIGIPRDRMTHLFHSFSQVDPSTTRKYGGTGLGLAISKRLAELMGGTAWAESELGVGSTFHFTVVAEPGPLAEHHYLRQNVPLLTGKRILIVDDNTTNRRILVKQALLWGMLPSANPSAVEALDLIRHGHLFDVAVLDVVMPEMDGVDLAWEIRKFRDARSLPIIMLTSMGTRVTLPSDRELTVAACLTKPIKPAQLYTALTSALGGARAAQPGQAAPSVPEQRLADQLPLRVLVAEDNVVNQKVVLRILARMGYRADVAANGLEVLDAIERQHYDVILMDVQMPEMDGIEAARRVFQRRDRHEAPRIIAMTANAMPGDRELCLSVGMDTYLTKPIDIDQLKSALLGIGVHEARQALDRVNSLDRSRLDYLAAMQDDENPHLVRELIDLFVADSPAHMRNLWDAYIASDAAALRQAAHRFKSSVDNIGASRMSSVCGKLEAMGQHGDVQRAQPLLTQLAQELERVRALLADERNRY